MEGHPRNAAKAPLRGEALRISRRARWGEAHCSPSSWGKLGTKVKDRTDAILAVLLRGKVRSESRAGFRTGGSGRSEREGTFRTELGGGPQHPQHRGLGHADLAGDLAQRAAVLAQLHRLGHLGVIQA